MSNFADVYLLPIPEENLPAYKKMAMMPKKGEKPIFDYKRTVYGGFKVLVDL